jgi:hypothetical protein
MTLLRRAALGAVTLAVALPALSGCTSFAETVRASSDPSPPSAPASSGCPATRAQPDPHRPRVQLDFRLADDGGSVTGTETVAFTPDRDTDRMVFRLVPNDPNSAKAGNRLTVDRVQGDAVARGGYVSDQAADPGGLYRVDLTNPLRAGSSAQVRLDFTLTLGSAGFDRFGRSDGVSWWASGAPLLAWEPGVGWAEDPFVPVQGETASSPAADTTLSVSAPQDLTVLMTGNQAAPGEPRDGRRTWTSSEPAARDVSVAAGRFGTEQRTTSDGVRVTVGVLPDPDVPADRLADWTVQAIGDLEQRLGPFPYRTLTVPLLRNWGGGIEYPSSILLAAPSRPVLVHEVAHMWFYGMVGNSQFRDPWLDEAFASYAEGLVDGAGGPGIERVLDGPGEVGAAIGDFSTDQQYFSVVYGKGEAALLTARQAAGADRFDAAIRCYVDANAWRIATPRAVGTALRGLPQAQLVLLKAGALQKDDLGR